MLIPDQLILIVILDRLPVATRAARKIGSCSFQSEICLTQKLICLMFDCRAREIGSCALRGSVRHDRDRHSGMAGMARALAPLPKKYK